MTTFHHVIKSDENFTWTGRCPGTLARTTPWRWCAACPLSSSWRGWGFSRSIRRASPGPKPCTSWTWTRTTTWSASSRSTIGRWPSNPARTCSATVTGSPGCRPAPAWSATPAASIPRIRPFWLEERQGTAVTDLMDAMRAIGFRFIEDEGEENPIAKAFALAEHITGVPLTEGRFEKAVYLLGAVPN
ncbi:DUF6461 domain-containing protein [Spirillospora sp. NBC_01491]|nr:DUF6461 domain-containing protein [Spirillospora sp. NBC_01491]